MMVRFVDSARLGLYNTVDMRWLRQAVDALGPGRHAEAFYEERWSCSLTLEEGRLEGAQLVEDRGVGLRLILDPYRVNYGYTTDLSAASLVGLARELAGQARGGPPVARGSPRPSRRQPPPPALRSAVRLLEQADRRARSLSPLVVQVRVSWRREVQRVLIVSREEEVAEERTRALLAVEVVAGDGGRLERGYEVVGVCGQELPVEPEALAEVAARRALGLLRAPHAPAGPMPVVMAGEAGGTMIHEAVGHGLEADLAQEGLSVYAGKRGQPVASRAVTVVDDPTLEGKRGSYRFDDEGVPAQRTVLIEQGVLRGYLYDRLRALREGVSSTGNGRRESFRHPPLVRMSNTFVLPGDAAPEEVVRSTWRGLLVRRMGGGQVNTVNGDFVFEVAEGYLIEGGQVGPLVRGAVLVGNGPEALRRVDLVGRDLGFAPGTCGKDGQSVPVADGQPTLRVAELVVGGRLREP